MLTNMPRLADLPPSAWAVVAALLALTLLLLLRRVWARLLGPVFVWETERLARRRGMFVLRVLFVSALAAALYAAWPTERQIAPGPDGRLVALEVARRFSQSFSGAFLLAQVGVLLFFTPLHLGGVITDEKEKRTLDFLLVTRLRDRDIILGKFGSRMLTLLMAELAALPVLAAPLLVGGMDLPVTLAAVAATGMTVLSVGAFAVLCSVLAHRTWVAVAGCYAGGLFAGAVCWTSPWSRLSWPVAFARHLVIVLRRARTEADVAPMILRELADYAALHVALAVVFLLVAWLLFRPLAVGGLAGALARPVRRQTLAEKPRRVRVYRWRANLPSVGNNPLYWKERYLGRTIAGTVIHNVTTACLAAFAIALTLVTEFYDLSGAIFPLVAGYLRGLAILTGFCLMIGLSVRLIGTISREREQRTLESLLTIPSRRRTILSAKWAGAWLRMGRYAVGLVLTLLLCGVVQAASVTICLLTMLVILVHALFAANLSLYLSTLCRSTARAYLGLALALVLLFAGTWAATELVAGGAQLSGISLTGASLRRVEPIYRSVGPNENEELALLARSLNPVLTWWRFLTYHPFRDRAWRDAEMHAQLVGTAVYAAAAGILWSMAHNRFRREAVPG